MGLWGPMMCFIMAFFARELTYKEQGQASPPRQKPKWSTIKGTFPTTKESVRWNQCSVKDPNKKK